MAKALVGFWGTDSYGRYVEVMQSVSGTWFARIKSFGWSRWSEIKAPTHPTRIKAFVEFADSPEYFDLTPEQSAEVIEWGFRTLKKYSETPNYRLPF